MVCLPCLLHLVVGLVVLDFVIVISVGMALDSTILDEG